LAYNVTYKASVEKDLKNIDKKQAKRILDAIDNDLADAPRKKGEPLCGEFEGHWKFVVRPYRVIYEIFDGEKTIRINRIGHRKDVYR
jgi:mRNA interferase RelE/StbE